jgi:hypothetical protein
MSEIITDIGFDSKSLWQPKGFEPHPFPESTWPLLKNLNLKRLTAIEGEDLTPLQENFKLPMAEGTFRHFYNEKIEKLALMWILISKSIAGGSWMGWPADDYDFPALVIAWEESKKRLHIIIDVMPIADEVEHEWYREKYLDGIEPVYNQYKDLIGPNSTYRWFRAMQGPYHIFDHPGEQRERSLQCEMEYIKYWAEVVQKAEPIKDAAYRQYANRRKRIMMSQLRQRDPLGSVLLRTLGPELGKKSAIGYT